MSHSFHRFFVSTKLLLKAAIGVEKIHSDATYKLIWQGYPVLQIGTSDLHRKYHPFGIAVCTQETTADFKFIFDSLQRAVLEKFDVQIKPSYLIADAAKSIQNAFQQSFDGGSVVMCWFHTRKAVTSRMEKHIHSTPKRLEFINDLHKLQLSQSSEIFDAASELFVEKWMPESKELLDYFRNEWLIKNRNWYEGFAKRVPSTNNSLEAFNRVVKDEQTLRARMDLAQFRIKVFEMVRQWSVEYASGLNKVNNSWYNKDKDDELMLDLPMWTASYNWANLNVAVQTIRTEDGNIYRPAGVNFGKYNSDKCRSQQINLSRNVFLLFRPTRCESVDKM